MFWYYFALAISIVILLVCAILLLGLIIAFIYYLLPYRIVFVPSEVKSISPNLISTIRKYIPDTENYNLVELGSGLGSVCRFINNNFKWRQATGVEGEIVIFTVSRIINSFAKNKLNLVFSDVFKYNIPEKSLIYCYFTNEIITRLYNEGRLKGHLLLSLTFSIKGIEPTEIVAVQGFQKKLLVYDFRND